MSEQPIDSGLNFDNSYAEQLAGLYVSFQGDKAPNPQLIQFNQQLAETLGLDAESLSENDLAAMLSGGTQILGATSLSQAYAGHQFGGFSPQLGDGRALLLGEVLNSAGQRFDIHLKGSGRTIFSRGGDGKAALAPVLREYLLAEAMHHLNVPTTRALAATITGEKVMRDKALPGAVLARVATSHIRVGTFQYCAARGETEKVKILADYSIARHYPELQSHPQPYFALIEKVADQQASLIAKWMNVGFVHGVMNTDNSTISGETIDYGPCAFLDEYNPSQVFSSIDRQGRYAYANQPSIGKWNLARFAETLLPLIDEDEDKAVQLATEAVEKFDEKFQAYWLEGMYQKLALINTGQLNRALVNDLLSIMAEYKFDFTQLFRSLSATISRIKDGFMHTDLTGCFKVLAIHSNSNAMQSLQEWHVRWVQCLMDEGQPVAEIVTHMEQTNPIYIPRNHKVEEALQAAERENNFVPFKQLLAVLKEPFVEKAELLIYSEPAPKEFGCYTTFCGT
ncbi:MAG: YdiU family protein [Oceanospirillaceae bacterium]